MIVPTIIILVLAWLFIIRLVYRTILDMRTQWQYARHAKLVKKQQERALDRSLRQLHSESGISYRPRK